MRPRVSPEPIGEPQGSSCTDVFKNQDLRRKLRQQDV